MVHLLVTIKGVPLLQFGLLPPWNYRGTNKYLKMQSKERAKMLNLNKKKKKKHTSVTLKVANHLARIITSPDKTDIVYFHCAKNNWALPWNLCI
jgi:hypothetical protein